jgi:uncharacterized alpha-E superfamily protein
MLSRLATNTVWLARYLERAESLARLVAVSQHLSLLPEYSGASEAPWLDALAVIGQVPAFTAKHGAVTPDTVLDFLLLDRENPSSLFSCLRSARENGRTARHLLTEAYWDALNMTWLSAQALDRDQLAQRGIDDVAQWVMQQCCLIRGAAEDLLRDDLPCALILGQSLERSDHVARLLSVFLRGQLADPDLAVVPGTPIYRRWEALLTAASLDESYRRAHSASIEPEKALRLILTHPTSPRSILVNTQRSEQAMAGLYGPSNLSPATREAVAKLQVHLEDAADGALLTGHLGTYFAALINLSDQVCQQALNDLASPALQSQSQVQ